MKKFTLILVLALLLVFLGYRWLMEKAKTDLELNSRIASVTDKIDNAVSSVTGLFDKAANSGKAAIRKIKRVSLDPSSLKDLVRPPQASHFVRIHLKHGSVISGKLLDKTGTQYTVEWKDSQSVIDERQIKSVEYISQRQIDWTYANDVVVRKKNGIVLDGKIIDVGPDMITMSFKEGGGDLEMGVNRSDIDCLLFAPAANSDDDRIEAQLKDQFPKMKVYRDGNIVLFSDSYVTSIELYRKTLRQTYSDMYLKFFKLFKDRRAQNQCFIVMFDDIEDYWTYAATDGVPGWIAVGYFSPVNKVLYTYNGFGERIEKWVFEVVQGVTGSINKYIDFAKQNVDERYHIFLDGQTKEFTDRFWDIYFVFKNELRERSLGVLRHEFAHEVLHNWGLQNIILVKPHIASKKLTEKKKKIMEAATWKEKKALLEDLMQFNKRSGEGYDDLAPEEILDAGSAQSWLNEGMAMYCATEPIGSVDEEWLFVYQEANRKNEVDPIEFFTNYKIGSFMGLSSKAMVNAYGHSWAFTIFLMNKYPDKFIDYQIKVADEIGKKEPKSAEKDTLKLLLTTLNKDLPTLEREFKDFMATYPKAEDPFVKQYMRYQQVWDDFYNSTVIGGAIKTKHLSN